MKSYLSLGHVLCDVGHIVRVDIDRFGRVLGQILLKNLLADFGARLRVGNVLVLFRVLWEKRQKEEKHTNAGFLCIGENR